jgi:hypothetical protein
MKLRSTVREWVKECGMKSMRATPGSGAQMELRSVYPRGGGLKRGGVRSVECITEVPVGIEELPSRVEERG